MTDNIEYGFHSFHSSKTSQKVEIENILGNYGIDYETFVVGKAITVFSFRCSVTEWQIFANKGYTKIYH